MHEALEISSSWFCVPGECREPSELLTGNKDAAIIPYIVAASFHRSKHLNRLLKSQAIQISESLLMYMLQ